MLRQNNSRRRLFGLFWFEQSNLSAARQLHCPISISILKLRLLYEENFGQNQYCAEMQRNESAYVPGPLIRTMKPSVVSVKVKFLEHLTLEPHSKVINDSPFMKIHGEKILVLQQYDTAKKCVCIQVEGRPTCNSNFCVSLVKTQTNFKSMSFSLSSNQSTYIISVRIGIVNANFRAVFQYKYHLFRRRYVLWWRNYYFSRPFSL